MQITCPNCSTRYMVADGSIGDAGRTVRCAACHHQWFQSPPSEEDLLPVREGPLLTMPHEEEAPPEPDIPESVKPRHEEEAVPVAESGEAKNPEQTMIARVCGFFSAFLVFLILFAVLVAVKDPLTRHYPASVMLYELIGMKPPVPGTGLIIDQLSAQLHKDGELTVEGRVINLTTHDIRLPPLAGLILNDAGEILVKFPIVLDTDKLEAEADIPFLAVFPAGDMPAVSVRVTFTHSQESEEGTDS